MIYSEAFEAMPQRARALVSQRLFEILAVKDNAEPFAHLASDDRQAIAAILRATKPGSLDTTK